ncbi:MAG TPA: CARDB domain-containing protein [Conexibacter sp.]|nr:CARDB domain-containing protein [Conexibacter sp.]
MVARLAVLLSVALALVPAATPARGADAASDASAGARLLKCHRAPTIDQRNAVVSTWMRPIGGGRHLAVKLDLWERTPGQRWALRTDVPGLGGWVTPSDAGVGSRAGDVFKYRQAVGRLEVPAAYRFHVAFRWLDDDGNVVRAAARTTAVCRQPDLRPDLVLRSVEALPAGGGLARYVVRVGNAGKSAIARATVAATLPGDSAPGLHTRTVRALAAGATAVIRFVGRGCAAGEQPASFVADPSNVVEEPDETNNGLAAVCPAP